MSEAVVFTRSLTSHNELESVVTVLLPRDLPREECNRSKNMRRDDRAKPRLKPISFSEAKTYTSFDVNPARQRLRNSVLVNRSTLIGSVTVSPLWQRVCNDCSFNVPFTFGLKARKVRAGLLTRQDSIYPDHRRTGLPII